MKDLNNIDSIEQYLNNELNEEERRTLESNLEKDDTLSQAFQTRKLAHDAIEMIIEDNLRDQLRQLEEEHQASSETEGKVVSMKTNRRFIMRYIAAAASVAILIGAFFFIQTGNQLTDEEVLANFYERPSFSSERGVKGASNEDINPLKAGLDALDVADYSTAIDSLGAVSEGNAYYISAQYYLGHALYLNGDFEQAMDAFDDVIGNGDIQFIENAQWYALLSCLNAEASCKERIDTILSDEEHFFYQKAVELSNQIEE